MRPRDQGVKLLEEPPSPMEQRLEQREGFCPPPYVESTRTYNVLANAKRTTNTHTSTSINTSMSSNNGAELPDKLDSLYILLDPDKFPAPHLANIEEDYPMFMPPLKSFPAPETPQEPMEFLSRSWSISSVDVARALLPTQQSGSSLGSSIRSFSDATAAAGAGAGGGGANHTSLEEPTLETAPFTFASTLTSQLVMDRLMAPSVVGFWFTIAMSVSSSI
jgi:hypothetical protein